MLKRSQYYENIYPEEDIKPRLSERDIADIVANCDYRIEADAICEHDNIDNKVNTADAEVFFTIGYNTAYEEIFKQLKPASLK